MNENNNESKQENSVSAKIAMAGLLVGFTASAAGGVFSVPGWVIIGFALMFMATANYFINYADNKR